MFKKFYPGGTFIAQFYRKVYMRKTKCCETKVLKKKANMSKKRQSLSIELIRKTYRKLREGFVFTSAREKLCPN